MRSFNGFLKRASSCYKAQRRRKCRTTFRVAESNIVDCMEERTCTDDVDLAADDLITPSRRTVQARSFTLRGV
jgi:hypothetical protein